MIARSLYKFARLLLTLILLLTTWFTYAQDSTYTPITYTHVVQVDSLLSAKELYDRAKTWFAKSYNSTKNVVQLDDAENGKLIGTGNMEYASTLLVGSSSVSGWVRYTITIQVKDGRYKWEFIDFTHKAASPKNGYSFGLITKAYNCPYKISSDVTKQWKNSVWDNIKEAIVTKTQSTLDSLKDAMAKPADKTTDW